MQDSEHNTMMTKMMISKTPVNPAVPKTQPTPVFTKKKYSHNGRLPGFSDTRAIEKMIKMIN